MRAGTRLPDEIAFLRGRISSGALATAARRARRLGTQPHDELTADGAIAPTAFAQALAEARGVRYRQRLAPPGDRDPFAGRTAGDAARLGMMVCGEVDGAAEIALAARGPAVGRRLADALRGRPALAGRLSITTPQAFTDAIMAAAGDVLVAAATRSVADLSARDGMVTWQKGALAGTGTVCAGAAFLAFDAALLSLLLVSSVFFLGVVALRTLATAVAMRPAPDVTPPPAPEPELPIYTVLVPLYREAGVVGRLIAALDGLDYPRALLDIKLIVEADDLATQAALRARALASCYEIVAVPDATPKTKPKALNVALALARGEFATIYDAEDRPQPDQLRAAVARFRSSGPELACLQARLAWYNWADNWLTRHFAIEYASLFDVLLPALDELDLPIPLGGTSNHFRIETLREVGAWDAWNVTEDADLGIRLARAGYRSAVLASSTWEEAPNRFVPWIKQRTRWLKGWLQTYMVHMRAPGDLLCRVGLKKFLAIQVLMGGVVASTLVHPLFITVLGAQVLAGDVFLGFSGALPTALITIGVFNLVAGYAAGFVMGIIALRRRPMPLVWLDLATLPVYWLLISIAAYRAIWQLATRPFHWEKTEHGLDRTSAALPQLRRG